MTDFKELTLSSYRKGHSYYKPVDTDDEIQPGRVSFDIHITKINDDRIDRIPDFCTIHDDDKTQNNIFKISGQIDPTYHRSNKSSKISIDEQIYLPTHRSVKRAAIDDSIPTAIELPYVKINKETDGESADNETRADNTLDRSELEECGSDEQVPGDDRQSREIFQTEFLTKFGTARDNVPGLKDAKSVTHVYNQTVLIADMLNNRVVLFDKDGNAVRSLIMKDQSEPWAAIMTSDGHIAVTLQRKSCLALWNKEGTTMDTVGEGLLESPTGLALDKSGRIYIADESLNDVLLFEQDGRFNYKLSEVSKVTFNKPRYLCCSTSGKIIVSDSGNHSIKIFNEFGEFLYMFGSYGNGNGQFKFPYGVCVDQEDNIIVADHYNHRISMFSEEGCFKQNLINSTINGIRYPCGLSVKRAHKRKLYITHGDLRSFECVVYTLTPKDGELTMDVKQLLL